MKSVLIIEPESALRWQYREELKKEGYAVITASDGEGALAKMRHGSIDVLILDSKPTNEAGWHCLQQILDLNRHVKVIINSAEPTDKWDFRSWIADAFLVKSGDTSDLRNTVNHMLRFRPQNGRNRYRGAPN